MKRRYRFPLTLLLAIALSLAMSTAAFADTDGTEPKIVLQPDQLVLQLGTCWAGVEFELRTDAGIFPAPVVVDENGVLTMDLGGSTTYTLSCIDSSSPVPDPVPEQPDPPPSVSPDPTPEVPSSPQPETGNASLPIPAVIFLVGLAVAGSAFIALHIAKKRRDYAYDEWEDTEDEP